MLKTETGMTWYRFRQRESIFSLSQCLFCMGRPMNLNKLIFTSTRKKWSPTWVKHCFTTGKTTSWLSEQFNAYSRNYQKRKQSLGVFFTSYRVNTVLFELEEKHTTLE